jgi:hypothetical protein
MKNILLVFATLFTALCGMVARAQTGGPCEFDLVSVPAHPSSTERIGLRLEGGIFGPGARPGAALASFRSNMITLDVVLTAERGAFPDHRPVGDVFLDVLDYVGPLAAGAYPVTVTVESFVDGVTNVPCDPVVKTLQVGTNSGPVVTKDAIEFYNGARDRFFLSADDAEIARLDQGVDPGWTRTGRRFKVYTVGASDGRGAPVVRFVTSSASGLDAHFWSASARENEKIPDIPPWTVEGVVFELPLPDTLTGMCPDHTTPVYRLFNPGNGDHRYTTDAVLSAQLQSQGWIAEGYGDRPVAMCAPTT